MFVPSESTIILACIGMVGLLASAVTVTTAFRKRKSWE